MRLLDVESLSASTYPWATGFRSGRFTNCYEGPAGIWGRMVIEGALTGPAIEGGIRRFPGTAM
jgi:hypothetical protein